MYLLLDCYSRNLATYFQCLRSSFLFHSRPVPALRTSLSHLFSRATRAQPELAHRLPYYSVIYIQDMCTFGGFLCLEGLKESARVFIDYDM